MTMVGLHDRKRKVAIIRGQHEDTREAHEHSVSMEETTIRRRRCPTEILSISFKSAKCVLGNQSPGEQYSQPRNMSWNAEEGI